MAATISPPGSALTAAPMPWNTSIEMPTVRNFRPLQVLDLGDRLLEPAERLGRHRPVGERHDVGADRGVELLEQLLAAAVLVPGQQHVGVHGVARARAPQRQRRLLAVVIDQHAVAAVERALGHRLEQAEGRHDGAGRQHLDLEIAAGHVVDLLGEVERVLVEDVLRRPGALPAHADRTLRLDDGGGGDGGAGDGRALQELATRITRSLGFISHCWFPPNSRREDEPAVEGLSRPIAIGSRARDAARSTVP